jgi:ribosomal protein S3
MGVWKNNNASQARTIKTNAGSVPAHTLRADIDYAKERLLKH